MPKFDFSVIMAVYNTAPFLRDAVDSLVNQTIGFSRIQLIMVDDGSTDGSGLICDEYGNRYPDNIIVIHKENGGVSSARNAGIPYVAGRYLNFIDSDDKMGPDAFEKVFDFFARNGDETDVVTIPMLFFDGKKGEYPHNQKFPSNADIIDLREYPYITVMACSPSFFLAESAADIIFDTKLSHYEDTKYLLQVLLKKMKLGLVRDATYWYRLRSGGDRSASQSCLTDRNYYLPSMEHNVNWALVNARDRSGAVPKFVQHLIMYHLQIRLWHKNIPVGILTDDEQDRYLFLLKEALKKIDADILDIVLAQGKLPESLKIYAISQKDGGLESRAVDGDIELSYEGSVIASVSKMDTVLELITYDKGNNTYTIEGHHLLYGVEVETAEPFIIVNGRRIPCEKVNRRDKTHQFLGQDIEKMVGFRGVFSVDEPEIIIRPAIKVGNEIIERTNLKYGFFFPVSDTYKLSYANLHNYSLSVGPNGIVLKKRRGIVSDSIQEMRFIREAWQKNLNYGSGRHGITFRLTYHLLKPFKFRKLWLVSDSRDRADDNGEAFFLFLREHKPRRTRVVYSINKDSKDFDRLSKAGKCVARLSFQHKILLLLCDVIISSQGNDDKRVYTHHEELRDVYTRKPFVFLQHGITKDDLSSWLNIYNHNFTGFVVSSVPERNSILDPKYEYGYNQSQVWLTGLPRYDRLYHAEKQHITIMPTWRRYLAHSPDLNSGKWKLNDDFKESAFYKFYDALLNSDRLLEALQNLGYTLQFLPHPHINQCIDLFHQDPRVVFLASSDINYRDVYAQSELVVTDYSSTVFDFAYLRKPIVYAQFDKEQFFSGKHSYSKGYFEYERDGFGEVVYDLEHTIDLIIEYARSGCVLKDIYRKRIDSFFAFNDQNNCKRVLDKILDIS